MCGKDVYKLLLQYILRALNSLLNCHALYREWPKIKSYRHTKTHPVFKYLAKHVLLTIQKPYNAFVRPRENMSSPVWFQYCVCGKLFLLSTTDVIDVRANSIMSRKDYRQVELLGASGSIKCTVCSNCILLFHRLYRLKWQDLQNKSIFY